MTWYSSTTLTPALCYDALKRFADLPRAPWLLAVRDGAGPGQIAEHRAAFAGRSSGHVFNIFGATDSADGFEPERAWARSLGSALAPHGKGAYVNFLMEEGEDRVREVYGAERFERLRALKRRYDPDNFFRLNQNIRPT